MNSPEPDGGATTVDGVDSNGSRGFHCLNSRPASPGDVPHVLVYVLLKLQQRDVCAALCVCREWRAVGNYPAFWKVLDLHGRAHAGEIMVHVLQQPRFQALQEINLEFAQGIDDSHFALLQGLDLRVVNLNACQMVTDEGVVKLASHCPQLRSFSVYWNLKVTERSLEALAAYCHQLVTLNISGCKSIGTTGMVSVAHTCQGLTSLNLTRCLKLTDQGLVTVIKERPTLRELWLYALSNLTDVSYMAMSSLQDLTLLDLCGAANLTDRGLAEIAKCSRLKYLNLTWCVQITDAGLKEVGKHCHQLQLLSIHGVRGITDEGIEALAQGCCDSLTTFDTNGCVGIQRRSKGDLLKLFPHLSSFTVHT